MRVSPVSTPRQPPVRRRLVAAGALTVLAILAAMVLLADALRHPAGPPETVLEGDPADPREEIECPEPEPREGEERDLPVLEPAETTVVEVGSADLLACPETYDQRAVRFRGEVIGGLVDHSDGVWAQINDDFYAGRAGPLPGHQGYAGMNTGIGVLLPADVVADVTAVGGPRARGDLVEVEGTFQRVDRRAAEVTVIRVTSLEILRPGAPSSEPLVPGRGLAALVLGAAALVLAITERVVARRR
jgi:hypothetical protein